MTTGKTPTWNGRHREGAMRVHRELKREEAEARNRDHVAAKAEAEATAEGEGSE